jgi:hypothetical protein
MKKKKEKEYWGPEYKRRFVPGYWYGKSGKKVSVRTHFKHYKIKEEKKRQRHKKKRKNWWWWVPWTSRVFWAGLIVGIIYLFAALVRATFFDNLWSRYPLMLPACVFGLPWCDATILGPFSNFIAFFLFGAAVMWLWDNRKMIKRMQPWFRGALIAGLITITAIIFLLIMSQFGLFALFLGMVLAPCYKIGCQGDTCIGCFYLTFLIILLAVMLIGSLIDILREKVKQEVIRRQMEKQQLLKKAKQKRKKKESRAGKKRVLVPGHYQTSEKGKRFHVKRHYTYLPIPKGKKTKRR